MNPVAEITRAAPDIILNCAPQEINPYAFLRLFSLSTGSLVEDSIHYTKIIRSDGISMKNVRQFISATGFTLDNLIAILGMATRTMDRRVTDGKLLPEEADKLFQVAKSFALLSDIMGDKAALTWFRTPHPLMDDNTPLEQCQTESGRSQVYNEIHGIRLGGY